MTEWKEYKLGEIVTFQRGHDLPKDKMIDGDIPVAGSNGIIGYHNQFTKEGPGVTIGRSGNIGIPHYYPNAYWAHNTVLYIFDFKGNDAKFMYYLLKTFDFTQLNTGSAVPSLNRNHIHELPVSIPDVSTQRRIAAILSSLDDKIDLLHRENASLEQMAETLFRQWFVEESKEEWEEGKLGDYVDETIGGEWGKENPEGDFIKSVQCIRGTDIADLSVGLATKTPIRYVKESKFEKIEPRNGDIIMEISGGTENQSTGRVAYVNDDVKTLFDYPIIFSNFCRLLRVKEEHTYFIYCYLKYLYEQDEFFNLENGSSGIKNLDYKALLYELTYPMPNDKQQILDFNDKVNVYFEKINRNKQQIQTLIQTRDGLLPRLMSGEIKV